jgi:hypothetical protein
VETEDSSSHVVCAWIGESKPVAAKHDLQLTDEHSKKRRKNRRNQRLTETIPDALGSRDIAKTSRKLRRVKRDQLFTTGKIAEEGPDPPSKSSKKTDDSARGGAKSGALCPASADDPSLRRVVNAWPMLTDAARTVILGIVRIDQTGRRSS